MKRDGKICSSCKYFQNKAGLAILISDKEHFKTKNTTPEMK